MRCDTDGCLETATIHVEIEGGDAQHLCTDHAIVAGWLSESLIVEDSEDFPRVEHAPQQVESDILDHAQSWSVLAESAKQKAFYTQNGYLLLETADGNLVAVVANEKMNHKTEESISRYEFMLNRRIDRHSASAKVIDKWLSEMK